MKILVTGANGLLGQHLVKILLSHSYSVIATGRGPARLPFHDHTLFRYYDADLLDEISFYGIFSKEKPTVVIHAGAMTQPDECEQNRDLCEQVNVMATAMVALFAEEFSKHLIYISTDFVFDGEKGNYSEEDGCNPVNWYGFTKVQAEGIVESCSVPWSIVRTCLVYGNVLTGTRSNLVNWVRENLENGKSIRVVNDQWRTPTYVEDLAEGILQVVEKPATGIYHLSGNEILTPYDMAVRTARHFKLNEALIIKTDASVFSQSAKRPPKTGFTIAKAQQELGYRPRSFQEGLEKL